MVTAAAARAARHDAADSEADELKESLRAIAGEDARRQRDAGSQEALARAEHARQEDSFLQRRHEREQTREERKQVRRQPWRGREEG